MSDEELVKRYDLQQPTHHMGSAEMVCDTYGDWVLYRDYKALADRNEVLEAERDEALNQLDSARHSVDVLEKRVEFVEGERRKTFQALLRVTKIHDEVEAKLAKAVNGFKDVIGMLDDPHGGEHVRDMRGATLIARKALSKLKGDTND